MTRCYETMTRVVCCGWVVRVWRTSAGEAYGPDEEVVALLAEETFHDAADIAKKVESIAGVAAYEILDGAGSGMVCYPEWP